MTDAEIPDIKSEEINPENDEDMRCAPSQTFQDGSCIPLKVLIEMAQGYNEVDKKNPIKLSTKLETLNPRKYKRYLVKEFGGRLDKVCDDQRCWVKQRFVNKMNDKMKTVLVKDTFRPEGPEGKFEWLNTFNINDVMGKGVGQGVEIGEKGSQYETKYPDFKFLGAVPQDFMELDTLGIKGLDLKVLEASGKTRVAMVINSDSSRSPGAHWYSLYSNLKTGHVIFSDSYGTAPPPRVRKFMRVLARYVKEKGIDPIVDYTRQKRQRGGTECGVFSLYFIVRMLEGTDYKDLDKEKYNDEDVNKLRQVYFS